MNRLPVSQPVAPAPQTVSLSEKVSDTFSPQGLATISLFPAAQRFALPGLQQIAWWRSGNPKVARTVRIQLAPLQGTAQNVPNTFSSTASPPTAPILGGMALCEITAPTGAVTKLWVPVPADFVVSALSVKVSVCGVALPYQAIPQACFILQPGAATVSRQVQCSITQQMSEPLPSIQQYPYNGANFGTNVPAGLAPLFPYGFTGSTTVDFSTPGFLRAIKITNATASTVYVSLVDAPANLTGSPQIAAAQLLLWGSCPVIAVPNGATVIERFDDLSFFWGPWVGITSSPGSGYVATNQVFVGASYVPVQPAGV